MPKKKIDYSKTCIYKLVHKDDLDDKLIYTGHTTDPQNRKYQHKHSCNNPNDAHYNEKKYRIIRENGGWDNWVMVKIEDYSCNSKLEAIAREKQLQIQLDAKLNTNIAGRTLAEYRKDNKIKIAEFHKRYREKNKNKIAEFKKIWGNKRVKCDNCGCEVCRVNLSRHKKTEKCINYNCND